MKITFSEIKEKFCNQEFYESTLAQSKEIQKSEFLKLEAIYQYFRYNLNHFSSEFYLTCVYPFQKEEKTKDAFEEMVKTLETFSSKWEQERKKEFLIPEIQEDAYPFFTPGKGGDFSFLWGSQFYFDDSSLGQSLIQKMDYYPKHLKDLASRIRRTLIEGKRLEKDKSFIEYGPFAVEENKSNYPKLCQILEDTLENEHEQRRQDFYNIF